MKKLSATGLILLVGLALAGCNGGGDNNSFGGGSGGTGGTSGGSTAPGDTGGASTVEFGSGSGSSFEAGTLAVATDNLSAGGTTTVTATLVNSDGTPYTGADQVTFVSNCVQQGVATLDSPVTTVNGAAISTYTAKGCSGSDTITATVTVNGVKLTATGVVTVAPPQLGSIAFVSANPSVISLKGTGLTETSQVTFLVLDSTGNPVPNTRVDFALSTDVGGISLSQTTATSGADGKVATVVQAGTVPTPVRVTATADVEQSISTQSSSLAIGTGIPDQDSLSAGPKTLNVEALKTDGIKDVVTVRLADRFNNPVPDGTTVSFHTDGGRIDSSCTTVNSTCDVTWTSQNPRPASGIVHLLAYVVGEESFTDTNGNGYFDGNDTWMDDGEPYEDDNGNGTYDVGEFFFDFNSNGIRDAADGHYEGLLCQKNCGPSGIATGNFQAGIGKPMIIVMSGSKASITTQPATVTQNSGFRLIVTDANGNPMPAGTTISLTPTNVILDTNSTSFTVDNDIDSTSFNVTVGSATGSPASISVKVVTPNQVTTTATIDVT